uniref:U4/U6.U5 trisnRNPassociated protein putative n=1 Tax=Albugo laibachii Nc14 TaxID=890382 RepID=F0W395_9STRA|nr:U4/U6.U5 trisnRNPassociated protein putative [Albugo laibachii Nc14]|eukprot:CCA15538.1 U4/U6.U5 trisnRNPassociated protein putative [Albugo laibachii Nc14]
MKRDATVLEESRNDFESSKTRRKCPYLDTINTQLLDFDFEKICSITLSDQNVYACLVCGKYFKGRGKSTHAFTHSVQASHHVFINLQNDRIFCLPDNYEVVDQSLKPIKDALRPTFTEDMIRNLDQNQVLAQDAFGVSYLPGFIGLNNLKRTDYISVVVHALAHIPPLRDFFLLTSNTNITHKSSFLLRFGELLCKIWSPYNIKNTISPHEFVQEVSVKSKRRFHIGQQHECIEFMSWLLNELHRELCKRTNSKKSIIQECFQGFVDVTTTNESATKSSETEQKEHESSAPRTQTIKTPFLFLSLDLPTSPLFKDSQGGNVIPQVPLYTVLEKYNGSKTTFVLQDLQRHKKTYQIRLHPRYLILHVKRFTRNNFFVEKNSTIVNFPVKNLEIREYLFMDSQSPDMKQLDEKSIAEMRELLDQKEIPYDASETRSQLLIKLQEATLTSTKYNLVANICHDSPLTKGKTTNLNTNPLTEGSYRVHVQNKATEQWYEIQDLHVQETLPQLIGVSETYMLIYERR